LPPDARRLVCKIAAKHLSEPKFNDNWQAVMREGQKVAVEIFDRFGVEGLQTIDELGISGMDISLLLLNLKLPDGSKLDLPGLYRYIKD